MDGRARFWRWFYDKIAWAYDVTVSLGASLGLGGEKKIRKELLSRISIQPGELIIDIGCGTASNQQALVSGHYVGLDISRTMLKLARTKLLKHGMRVNLGQADAVSLPLASGVAKLVIAMGVLQHTSKPEHGLKEMVRVTKPGAQILLIDEKRSARNLARRLIGNNVKTDPLKEIERWSQKHFELESPSIFILGDYFVIRFFKVQAR